MKQGIGIPMGIDPALFWENLFLYFYEEEYMSLLISSDKSRSSRAEVFCKKGFLRNFAKFTGKHLCQSFFLNKFVQTLARVISCEFCEISKNTFSHRTPLFSQNTSENQGKTFPAKRFIDDICTTNDGGKFGWSICDIYPKELEFQVEHARVVMLSF